MSKEEKKKKQQEALERSEITEISAEVGYVQEQAVQNVSDFTKYDTRVPATTLYNSASYGVGKDGKIYGCVGGGKNNDADKMYDMGSIRLETTIRDITYTEEGQFIQLFQISNMRQRIENGESLDHICEDMKTFINDNKDSNPDMVQYAISQLLSDAEEYYDDCIHLSDLNYLMHKEGYHREHLGDNSTEILQKIIDTPEGEKLHGLVCSTIAELGMRLLEECGIKAVMLSGGTDSSNHTTLLWQRSDGKYVQNNYGKSYTLDATNMKDAAREVYKKYSGLLNNGYIYFIDNDGSYQEFAMKEEAVWGEELDKRDYNNLSVFDHSVANKTSIQGNAAFSNLGSVSAEVKGTLAYSNDNKVKETSFSLGYKKNGVTSLADSSTSIGAKIEHKTETLTNTGKKFYERKIVADYTEMETYGSTVGYHYFNPVATVSYGTDEQIEEAKAYAQELFEAQNGPLMSKEEFLDSYLKEHPGCKDIFVGERADAEYAEYVEKYNKELAFETESILCNLVPTRDYTEEKIPEDLNKFDGYKTKNLTLFLRQTFGKEKTLLKDNGVELTNGYRLSGTIGLNDILTYSCGNNSDGVFTSFGGDIRLAAEEGLKLDVYNKTSLFSTSVSGGVTADMSLKSGTLTPTVSPGVKLNGSTSYQTRLNDNASLGAGLSGYSVVTRPSIDYGASAQIQGSYKPSGSDVTIFGSANYGLEKQRIRIGGFNEQTENVRTLGVSVGAQLGQKGSVSLNYNGRFDKLNSTRDRSVVSIGARVNL